MLRSPFHKNPPLQPLGGPQSGRISGRIVVPAIFGFAILLASIVFMVGLKEKHRWDHVSIRGLQGDTVVVTRADSLRHLMKSWPSEWLQVSRIDDHFSVVVPCFSETPKLTLSLDSLDETAAPLWLCPFCETSDSLRVLKWIQASHSQKNNAPSQVNAPLSEPAPVHLFVSGDSSPWIYLPAGAKGLTAYPSSLGGPALILPQQEDSLWFFPADSLSGIEIVREEDENPEGCQPSETETESLNQLDRLDQTSPESLRKP